MSLLGVPVERPIFLVLSVFVLSATVVYWFATGRRGQERTGPPVTVNVDPVRCARFGYCEHEAPHVFQVRREGRLTYRDRVPVEELEPVVRAAEVCPARAISLGRLPRGY